MQKIQEQQLEMLIEATIFISKEPISINQLLESVLEPYSIKRNQIKKAITKIQSNYINKGINLVETGSGFKFQTNPVINEPLSNFWSQTAPRYSRALLETLALIAFKQPVTRAEIEKVRGVSVSQTIMKTLKEREWIKVVGHKEVPGRPSLYGTTNIFLDYFNLKSIDDLPELKNVTFEEINEFAMNKNDENPVMDDNAGEIDNA